MNESLKKFIALLLVPIILLLSYFLMCIIWKGAGLPSDSELPTVVRGYFSQYGLWIVFVGALIEGFLLLGMYFPGSFIIFLGVISAGKDIPRVVGVISVVSIAFLIAYILNYIVGRYGWYKLFIKYGLRKSLDSAKERLSHYGLNAIIFSYWEPNLASITATAAGVLNYSFKQFLLYSCVGVIIWNMFWGTLVFSLGESALQMVGLKYVLIVFFVWVLVILAKQYFFKKNISR